MAQNNIDDARFRRRIETSILSVKAWDEDLSLLAECRALLPWDDLRDCDDANDTNLGPYSQSEDSELASSDARLLQRLARYFKDSMTWVNAPACGTCGQHNKMEGRGGRGPNTAEEHQGQADRVEVYQCTNSTCGNLETVFPRYNSVRKLLETRKGRCGEYANLFGLVCRAAGFTTRYISDFTDHVWIECKVDGHWIMADACEGVINEPSMYEKGWGKKLNYILGIGLDHVVDVTGTYTRQFNTEEFQLRRRGVTSSEYAGENIIEEQNRRLRGRLPHKAVDELNRRLEREGKQQLELRLLNKWKEDTYGTGRLSGSLVWKLSRDEAGRNGDGPDKTETVFTGNTDSQAQFYVESFFPHASAAFSITVQPQPHGRHDAIDVSGTKCAVGSTSSLSVVVVDEKHFGCILQSRAFGSLTDLAHFVETIPKYRIIAICGRVATATSNAEISASDAANLSLLGGFNADLAANGVLFIGQVQAHPDWAHCASFEASPNGFRIEGRGRIDIDPGIAAEGLRLRTERQTKPCCIAGRLPESIMPLQTQLLATEEQKRAAFMALIKRESEHSSRQNFGYTTKPGSPIYLLCASAYPFERDETEDVDDCWNCFLLLPPSLVEEDDIGIVEPTENKSGPNNPPPFEVPLDTTFFVQHLGSELLAEYNGATVRSSTAAVLGNTKLVAFYFSAHWCPPCKTFTPMLAEMYTHLKDKFPTHGLEIVFVSSDRDANGFNSYYNSMPWLSIPFESLPAYKQLLSTKYGVRGIPALVVLDAMSGQVVVPADASRGEVSQACSRGESGIEALLQSWLSRIPPESQEILTMLELSCADDHVAPDSNETPPPPVNPYLVRKEKPTYTGTASEAEAVWEPGPLNGKAQRLPGLSESEKIQEDRPMSDDDIQEALGTALKYLENAQKAPWSPKFRTFKLGNKVADRITRIKGGVDLVRSVGFEVAGTSQDFVATIPLVADLDKMHSRITSMMMAPTSHQVPEPVDTL
jgi:thiol-disulfide isomerase/thioredoxin